LSKENNKSLPSSDKVSPVVQHHSTDDFLPATVDVADGTEWTYSSIDERRAEQVLQRTILVYDRINGVSQQNWPPGTEAVEEGGGGMWRGCVVASQLDRR